MHNVRVLTEVENDSDFNVSQIVQKGWICTRCNTSVNPNEKICPGCSKIREENNSLKNGKEILCG